MHFKQLSFPGFERYITPVKWLLSVPSWSWSELDLVNLSLKQLRFMCCVMGIASTGIKSALVGRLLECASVRSFLNNLIPVDAVPSSQFDLPPVIQAAVKLVTGKELKQFCRAARIYAPSNKYGMMASLLNWRAASARRGQSFIQSLKAA